MAIPPGNLQSACEVAISALQPSGAQQKRLKYAIRMAKHTVSRELSSGLGFVTDVLCGPGQVIALPFPYL